MSKETASFFHFQVWLLWGENKSCSKTITWPFLNIPFFSFYRFSHLDLRQNLPGPFKNGLLHLCTDFCTVVAFFKSAPNNDIIITENKRRRKEESKWKENPSKDFSSMRAAFLLELKVPLPKCWCETNECYKKEKEGGEKKGVGGRAHSEHRFPAPSSKLCQI